VHFVDTYWGSFAEGEWRADWIDTLKHAIQRWPDVFGERISERRDLTLIHGDLHPLNCLIPDNTSSGAPILLDWGGYASGVGAYDLAKFLINLEGSAEVQEKMVNLYYVTLAAHGLEYSRQQFEFDFRLSVIAHLWPCIRRKDPRELESTMRFFEKHKCEELLN
jgi:thiamine kinase-like enzyme